MRRIEHVMGLPVVLDLVSPTLPEPALEDALAWLHEVDGRFSTYRPDSEISRLNRGELALADAHPDVREVLEACEALRVQTRGFFDVRAPYLAPDGPGPAAGRGGGDSIDPSGYVKGWAVAGAAARLREAGAKSFILNGGGDMVLCGSPAEGGGWRVGIQHPRETDRIVVALELEGGAVATSGTYARGGHIVNPLTGRPPEGLLSVTVLGPDLATADAYATSAFAMGVDRAAAWCALLRGYEAILVCADGTWLSTRGIEALRTT